MITRRTTITTAIAATTVLFGTLVMAATGRVMRQSEPADLYKSKCVTCHGKNAEKKFDTTLTDDQMVEIVLKGKKAEKPPNMPGYAEKGVTPEQAKAVIEYMKQLKAAAK